MSLSRPVLNLDALVAIDVHTHAETDGRGHYSLPDDMRAAADTYFGAQSGPPDVHQLAAYYRQRNMAAVVFTVDAESTLGHGRLRNEEIAEAAAQHPDVLIPFASIDPAREGRRARGASPRHRLRCPRVQVPPKPAGFLA